MASVATRVHDASTFSPPKQRAWQPSCRPNLFSAPEALDRGRHPLILWRREDQVPVTRVQRGQQQGSWNHSVVGGPPFPVWRQGHPSAFASALPCTSGQSVVSGCSLGRDQLCRARRPDKLVSQLLLFVVTDGPVGRNFAHGLQVQDTCFMAHASAAAWASHDSRGSFGSHMRFTLRSFMLLGLCMDIRPASISHQ